MKKSTIEFKNWRKRQGHKNGASVAMQRSWWWRERYVMWLINSDAVQVVWEIDNDPYDWIDDLDDISDCQREHLYSEQNDYTCETYTARVDEQEVGYLCGIWIENDSERMGVLTDTLDIKVPKFSEFLFRLTA